MQSLEETFKEGLIVWAEWDDVKLRSNVGVVDSIHPPSYVAEHRERNGEEPLDKTILVKLPGYVSERGFMPWTQCRPATENEKRQYFKDVLKYGD